MKWVPKVLSPLVIVMIKLASITINTLFNDYVKLFFIELEGKKYGKIDVGFCGGDGRERGGRNSK